MNIFKKIILSVGFILFIAAPIFTVVTPGTAVAGPACEQGLLGMPPWYRGLTDDDCGILPPEDVGGLGKFITIIILNVIEIGLFIAGYAALFFVLYGGFLFLTGGNNPSQIERGRKSIINAVIGLVISIAAIAIVKLIFGVLA